MSRCFPYPPPYLDEAEIESIKAEIESIKLQKEKEKKDRKKEKRAEKKANKLLEKPETSEHSKHSHKKRKHEDNSEVSQKDGYALKKVSGDSLEKSGLSEEHEPPFIWTIHDSPGTSQDSSKRRKVVVLASPGQANSGILRIKLPILKKRDAEPSADVPVVKPRVSEQPPPKQMGGQISIVKRGSETPPCVTTVPMPKRDAEPSTVVPVVKPKVHEQQPPKQMGPGPSIVKRGNDTQFRVTNTMPMPKKVVNWQQNVTTQRKADLPGALKRADPQASTKVRRLDPQPPAKLVQKENSALVQPPTKVRRVETQLRSRLLQGVDCQPPSRVVQRVKPQPSSRLVQQVETQLPSRVKQKVEPKLPSTVLHGVGPQPPVKLVQKENSSLVQPPTKLRQVDPQPPSGLVPVDPQPPSRVIHKVEPQPPSRVAQRVEPQPPSRMFRTVDPQLPAKLIQKENNTIVRQDAEQPALMQKTKVEPQPPSRVIHRVKPQPPSRVVQRVKPPLPSRVFHTVDPQLPAKVLQKENSTIVRQDAEQPAFTQKTQVALVPPVVKDRQPEATFSQEEPCFSGRKTEATTVQDVGQSSSGRKSSKAENKERKFRDLFVSWNPPSIQLEGLETGDEDWLSGSTKVQSVACQSKGKAIEGGLHCQGTDPLFLLQPTAIHLPDLHMYQLPYVVPF